MPDSRLLRKIPQKIFHPGSKHGRNRLGVRTRFQRWVWAGVFLTIYLMIAINTFDQVDEESSNLSLWILLIGSTVSCILGAFLAPYIPGLLGFSPSRRDSTSRSRKTSRTD